MLVSFPLLAMSRPDNRDAWGYTAMGIICIVGALTFTAIFYFIIRRRRRSKHEDTAA
jgi:Na+/melibiose symporter-like transporter